MLKLTDTTDIKYSLNYETKEYYPCMNGSDCCDNDYCRCRQITGLEFDKNEGQLDLLEYVTPNSPEDAALWGWYLRRLSLDEHDVNWYSSMNYYGEEVEWIHPTAHLVNQLDRFDCADPIDKLQICLNTEYGYISRPVLEKLVQGKLELKRVSPKKIAATTSQLDKSNVDFLRWRYAESEKIKDTHALFALKDGDMYRLVDGHHRFKHWQQLYSSKKKFPVLILE